MPAPYLRLTRSYILRSIRPADTTVGQRIKMRELLLLLVSISSAAANRNQLPPKVSYYNQEETSAHWEDPSTEGPWTTRYPTSDELTPTPKDCNEVCRDISGPQFIPDYCCSRHYCACDNGFGQSRSCNEGEGFCIIDGTIYKYNGKCSEGGCSPETCCEGTTTTELATTEPATTEPATTQPATTEPATTQPSTTEPSTTSGAACPLGWIDDGNLGCFLFAPQMARLTWIEALEYCEEQVPCIALSSI